jgi:hypothetical protein
MNDVVDQLPLTYAESPLLYWVLGSVLAYALATNALSLAKARGFHPLLNREWLIQVARFAFYLGIPYLALGGWPRPPFSGLLSLQDMGLVGLGGRWSPTRWLEAVGSAVGFGLVALLLLLLAWANANRHTTGTQLHLPPRPWWMILIDALYLQVHWAFYRGALAVELGDVYTGVFLGLGLIYLEWALNPFWRQGWRTETLAAGQWLRAALALVVAILFLFTRNLWVCLGVHGALELTFQSLGRERTLVQAHDPDHQSATLTEPTEATEP